ncbi:hypothetical protein [Roseibacillus ishigakijimensis]|uniref:Autotransporter-associated beta strand repeat-containing protein n=1 Tax=Roseibacillus ishigakijimensis TaxID=454146 RepID=A0A934RRM6_9BACT|nr:hypothetical protein [Roseibacillus ishigakijimensis]MBK1833271.1 hypothetical protein [Roseibacillus ishigakijimensis]
MTNLHLPRLATSLPLLTILPLAAQNHWTLNGDGLWHEASHWSDDVPDNSTEVRLGNGGTSWIRDAANANGLLVGRDGSGSIHLGEDGVPASTPTLQTRFSHLGYNGGDSGSAQLFHGTWNNDLDILIGRGGEGDLTLSNNSEVTTDSSVLGYFGGATGKLTLGGTARFQVNSTGEGFVVGRAGSGTVNLTESATLSTTGNSVVAAESGSTGILNISGGSWLSSGLISLGQSSQGTLNLAGGTVESRHLFMGLADGSSGSLNLQTGGTLTIEDTFSLGRSGSGTGTLTMSGGELNSYNTFLGTFGSSSGSATLRGTSQWTNSNEFTFGYATAAENTLGLEQDAQLTTRFLTLGASAGSQGSIELHDNSRIVITGGSTNRLDIGRAGTGSLSLNDNSQVLLGSAAHGREVRLGVEENAVGILNVSEGVFNNTAGNTLVGVSGSGTVNLINRGNLIAHHLQIGSQAGSTGVVNIGPSSDLHAWTITTHPDSDSRIHFDTGAELDIDYPVQNLFENFKAGEIVISDWASIDIMGNAISTAPNFAGFSGGGTLLKTRNGSLTLHGDNDLSTLNVGQGGLYLEGSLTGTANAYRGTTIGGSGTFAALNLENSTLAPGSSPGHLTAQSLTLADNSRIQFELGLNPATSDLITVTGALASDGSVVTFDFQDNGWVAGRTYDLIHFGSSTIDPADYQYTAPDASFAGVFSQTGSLLQFTTVPEPATGLLTLLASLPLLRRRRPSTPSTPADRRARR